MTYVIDTRARQRVGRCWFKVNSIHEADVEPQAGASASGAGRKIHPGEVSALLVSEGKAPHELSDDPFFDAAVQMHRAIGLIDAELKFPAIRPDLVFLPVSVDGRSSRQFLDQILSTGPQAVVVVIASNDQINAAAEAMRVGAFDCLFRPFSSQRLAKTLAAALDALPAGRRANPARRVKPKTENGEASPSRRRGAGSPPEPDRLSGSSPQMRRVLTDLDAVAASDAAVFIVGEDGTGKTLAARRLHEHSLNAAGPLITFDCATLTPDNSTTRLLSLDGAIGHAAGGTLYLDEVCELEPGLQPRLLNVLDREGDEPGTGPRLVASSRHNPREAIRTGHLLPELYYRLCVASVTLPPLRDREGDIRTVAEAKLAEYSRAEGRSFTAIRDDAMALLEAHDWPGNLRELAHAIWSAVILNDGPELTPEMLPADVVSPVPHTGAAPRGIDEFVGMTLDEIERAVIEATIRAEGGSIPRAARLLDVSPSTIYRKREGWAKRSKS